MRGVLESRRRFLKMTGLTAGAMLLPHDRDFGLTEDQERGQSDTSADSRTADYTLHIKTVPIEIGRNRIISVTTYNRQFPGPLVRLKEGKQAVVDVYNDTDVPEQLHWHGRIIPVGTFTIPGAKLCRQD